MSNRTSNPLVDRLADVPPSNPAWNLCQESADEIDRLTARVAELTETIRNQAGGIERAVAAVLQVGAERDRLRELLKRAMAEMCHVPAPRHSFTATVDALDDALRLGVETTGEHK